ncbi:unnamed protein product [Hymenolepis diminuta]|uniref:CTP synthase N-terminal domain-containing protein n=1 Tax=Hymenolepis diminuta TaxID=6216 RepID=A0A564Z116_HYMDI|nr:unnamed protein product [Hymenolepis diminuta]
MKYLLVTGGVISGIGKGIVSSSIGAIMKANGWVVTCIKIDPYLNIDAGTFSPYEHGEVYVLDDGSEVDLDLGNYERYINVTLTKDHNITTGKIYEHVAQRERRGEYLGKTVQVVPHITDAIQEWVIRVAERPVDASNRVPELCLIELGGTIGDIESMPFVEAFRQLQYRVGPKNFCCVHVSLVPNLYCRRAKNKTNSTLMAAIHWVLVMDYSSMSSRFTRVLKESMTPSFHANYFPFSHTFYLLPAFQHSRERFIIRTPPPNRILFLT